MTIEELHNHLFEVLKVVDGICKEHHIRYCLDGGTELGAVRDHDFIAWDDDMDICVLVEDYDEFVQIMKQNLPEHYHLVEPQDSSPFFYDNASRIFDDRWQFEEKSGEQVYNNYQSLVGTDVYIYCGCPGIGVAQKLFVLKNKIFHGMLMAYRLEIDWDKYTMVQKMQVAFLRLLGRLYSGTTPDRILKTRRKWMFHYDAEKTGYRFSVNAPILKHYMNAMKNEWFDSLSSAKIRGMQFPVEGGYDGKLTTIYGDYMTPVRNSAKYFQHLK